MNQDNIGLLIRNLRTAAGMKQAELAEKELDVLLDF